MTEEELAIFDLLTKPEPVLTDDERETVKASAKQLLAHLHDKLVLDWRRKAATTADVRSTDPATSSTPTCPQTRTRPDIFDAKVQARLRPRRSPPTATTARASTTPGSTSSCRMGLDVELAGPLDVNQIADDVVARIHSDPDFAAQVAEQLQRSELWTSDPTSPN